MADGEVTLQQLRNWITDYADVVGQNRDYLTELDAAIGDSDHGINMARGMAAAVGVAADPAIATPKDLLTKVGMKLVSTVGGASGPLYGTFFLRLGGALGADGPISATQFAGGLRAGADGVVARGKAVLGDKTMVDVWLPALDTLDGELAAGRSWNEALVAMSIRADAARDATTPLLARKGRASYLGERSVGHQDPGATSTALLIASAARELG